MLTPAALLTAVLAGCASGQQLFVPAPNETTTGPEYIEPTYRLSEFAYTQSTTTRYAIPLPSPTTTKYYAKPYSELAHLAGNVSTTTWGNWNPHPAPTERPTDTDDPYGQAAWSGLWDAASLANFTWGQFSTTVKPTPVPTEELVLPPSDPFTFGDNNLTFPKDFVFGVAGSASQIEGAIAEEGRGPSVQDKIIPDSRPKDYVTNENYYLYKQDIARLAAMGIKYYSFTIPWSRILPFADPGSPVNKQGIDHYDDLINTVLDYGMLPMVTLTHFDTPLVFNGNQSVAGKYDLATQYAGFANETFVDAFVNYAKIVLTHYADRVPIWVSINEPYLYAGNAQGIKHVVQAHAEVYHFYHDELKGEGKFGIKFNNNFGMPLDPKNKTDLEATQRFQDFQLGALCNPIFLGEDYPETWKETFKDSGLNFTLTQDELNRVANTSDFFGIDPYTITVITPPPDGIEACAQNKSHPLWPTCVQEGQLANDGWAIGYRSQSYVYTTPTYFRSFLNYLWNTFKKPVFPAEFGFPVFRESEKELADQLFDTPRSVYYRSYMNAMLEAIHYDNVNVMGATAWSFADNWEFGDYEQQFGLQVVNRTTQQRFYKKSLFDLVDFVRQRSPYY